MTDKIAQQYRELCKERDAILAETGDLKVERDKLDAKIRPTIDKIRDLNKQIAELEQPDLADLQVQIEGMEKTFGDRAKQPAKDAA